MNNDELIYVAGHRGLVGSAIVRRLQQAGYTNLLLRTSAELDLTDQAAARAFFAEHRPAYVFLAALVQAIVGYHGRVQWDTTMPDGTPRKLLDLTRLHALGWHAAISLEEGITRVYQDYCRAG